MKLSDFDYFLPKELIAQYPLREREMARLLVLKRKSGKIEHRYFKDVTEYFKKDDLLVLNDTKVLPARLIGSRQTGGKVELLLLENKEGLKFSALIKPGRLKLNEKIIFNGTGLSCKITGKKEVTFHAESLQQIYAHGLMPLPPYIKRKPEESDFSDYQTVYARKQGSVASPTAGLHFTRDLLEKIRSLNVNSAYITLHVSYATFKPVRCEDVASHTMEKEYYQISDQALQLIEQTRKNQKRIIAVGTTSCRSLEANFLSNKKEGFTDLFIYPGYKFSAVDCLITNFHLPRTTLFMLVSAFAGTELVKKAYQEAIDRKYRFYSYGDAMLIL
ncbi:MAG: tRNA preQ1(34) S-adenosylmethionine ribosyltransferase-isomerase QueA [Candidatus Omnitrophota bacterium]|nr:MAG: tRNA preQ1(34) S-adenosylmethionine ribosyltransferase-isomerase QueA [Candidatus Omnitrophota bacterium]